MNPKNGYEARLAKMAGDENVTIPKPTNAYMKYMDDIEDGGGGSALPAVTAADNGKVLTVVEGAWDKADAAGGGGNNSIILKISDPEGIGQYAIDSPVEFSTLMQTYWQYDKIDAIEVEAGFQSAVNVQFYQGESSYISMEFIQFDLTGAPTGVSSATFRQFIWDGATVTKTEHSGRITFS